MIAVVSCAWCFRRLIREEEAPDEVVRAIQSVFGDGFGLDRGWSESGIEKRLRESPILGLLDKAHGEFCGHSIYSVQPGGVRVRNCLVL